MAVVQALKVVAAMLTPVQLEQFVLYGDPADHFLQQVQQTYKTG
jgi:hypothetical protein